MKEELVRLGLSLAMFYNANGVIINKSFDAELVLLETFGPFGACTNNKETTDHIKAAYGLLAMLHGIAYRFKLDFGR